MAQLANIAATAAAANVEVAIEATEVAAAVARARAAGDESAGVEVEAAVDPFPLVGKRVVLRFANKRNPLHGRAGR